MKKINFWAGIFILLLLGFIVYLIVLINKPATPQKPEIITHIEYKDSPLVDSLKKSNDSLLKIVVEKKKIFYKYITIYKDILKVQHDTIVDVLFIGNEIIETQDSIINNKDSIILDLTENLNLTRDTLQFTRILVLSEKGKVKKWRRISIASLIANGILILK